MQASLKTNLSFFLFSFLLFPAWASAVPGISCRPQIPYQGEVTQVSVERGFKAVTATLTYGRQGSARSQDYSVDRKEIFAGQKSTDLGQYTYKGISFALQVDEATQTANLKARIGDDLVNLMELSCEFHAFDPHPGVTMSN